MLLQLNRLGRVIKNLTATDYPAYITQLILAFQVSTQPPASVPRAVPSAVMAIISYDSYDVGIMRETMPMTFTCSLSSSPHIDTLSAQG